MVNKTKRSKELIEQALRAMPQDFSLRDARIQLTRALKEILKVETQLEKKQQQLTPEQKWKLDMETGMLLGPQLTPSQHKNVLDQIESLISKEENKIRNLNKKDMLLED